MAIETDATKKEENYNIRYMAPELFTSKNVTQAMDIWSIGVIFY